MVDVTTRLGFWTARHRPDLPHPAPLGPAFVRSNRYDDRQPTYGDVPYFEADVIASTHQLAKTILNDPLADPANQEKLRNALEADQSFWLGKDPP